MKRNRKIFQLLKTKRKKNVEIKVKTQRSVKIQKLPKWNQYETKKGKIIDIEMFLAALTSKKAKLFPILK